MSFLFCEKKKTSNLLRTDIEKNLTIENNDETK